MSKVNVKNELIKRKFFKWLRGAGRCCDSTVNYVEKAILLYEDFTKQSDFGVFNSDRAMAFKEWLKKKQFRGKTISIVTYCTYLRFLRKFFSWLSYEIGYKSKISPTIVDFLRASEKEERTATQYIPRKYPPLEYVIKITDSIKINSEIDLRDRALIAFTLLSGMRDKAIATLPLGCFDEISLIADQNPRKGVQTKFSKHIITSLLRFDEKLVDYVKDWVKHLKNKGFGSQDPLFPRSKVEKGKDGLAFESASSVEPVFWQSAGRIRKIFKKRSQEAGLSYYSPHTFRHLAIDLAFKRCRTMEEAKAISQNLGHEHIETTFSSYANYPQQKVEEILKNMDFSGKPVKSIDEKLDELINEVKKKVVDK